MAFLRRLRLHVLHFEYLMLKQKGNGKGKKTTGKDSLIRVLLWSAVLVKARATGSAGNRLLLPPLPKEEVSVLIGKPGERSLERPQNVVQGEHGQG